MAQRDKENDGREGMRVREREKGRKEGSVTTRLMKWISPLVAMATAVVDE